MERVVTAFDPVPRPSSKAAQAYFQEWDIETMTRKTTVTQLKHALAKLNEPNERTETWIQRATSMPNFFQMNMPLLAVAMVVANTPSSSQTSFNKQLAGRKLDQLKIETDVPDARPRQLADVLRYVRKLQKTEAE